MKQHGGQNRWDTLATVIALGVLPLLSIMLFNKYALALGIVLLVLVLL